MAGRWRSTKYPGIRYREHSTRAYQNKPDRYFTVSFRRDGKLSERGLGWASEGWTTERASIARGELLVNGEFSPLEPLREAEDTTPQQECEPEPSEKATETVPLPALHELQAAIAALKALQAGTVGVSDRLATERSPSDAMSAPAPRETFTFKQASERYMEVARIDKRSWRDDEVRLKLHILPVLGEKALEQITVADVEKLKVTVSRKGLSAATVRQALALTRRVFNVAEQHGLTSMKNPVTPVKFPKTNNARTRFLSRDEAETLLREAKKWNVTLHDTCLIALYTGMRAGEILRLRWSDVDFEHKVITLRDTKNGSTRYAYLTDNVRAALEARREAQREGRGGTRHEKSTFSPTGLVFPGEATPKAPHGRTRENMAQQFRRLVKRLGWNDGVTDRRQLVVFHTLRHTFASWLTMDGTPLLVTKELLGHKCIEMTMRYSHLAPNQARAAVERLVLNGGEAGA